MYSRIYLKAMLLFLVLGALGAQVPFVSTPRDTGLDPQPFAIEKADLSDYSLLTETENLRFYFRDDRDVMAIEDRRNGYVWKTGLDIPFNRDIDDMIDEGADPYSVPPKEARLNTTYTGIANSIISIEYFDDANNIKRIGSAAYKDSESELIIESSIPFRARLEVRFKNVDIGFDLFLSIEGDELAFSLPEAKLYGEGLNRLHYVNLAPFFGSGGGQRLLWDSEEENHVIAVKKAYPDGYAVVPDGSGALIRFADNTAKLSEFDEGVYGHDFSQSGYLIRYDDFSVPPKSTNMPLFGIVHGRKQNAFAAYATEGAEYLIFKAFPEEHTTYYTQAYPSFLYNRVYYQIYNRNGDGYYRTMEESNSFDLEFRYKFLEGNDADYSGIARVYRRFLEGESLLPKSRPTESPDKNIPLRLDFIMSDVRDNIIGQRAEVTTTIEDVRNIINDLTDSGIDNISAGLLGYGKGGTVLFKPGTHKIESALGSAREFREIIGDLADRDVDISFSRDYSLIGEGQIMPWGNAVRGISGWYINRRTFQANAPVNMFYYARPEKAARWLEKEWDDLLDMGVTSHSVKGIPQLLMSDYSDRDVLTTSEIIDLYDGLFSNLSKDRELNLYNPNQYLWKYTDRFLHMPVFSTQYLIETDTVPLLPMVLQGSMEMFAPYSNFSFYSTGDILRMIDYNVYPSFLLTRESAHLLLATNSSENYSSQYDIYRDLILHVYGKVNDVLGKVMDARWIDREVPAEGVAINVYDNGGEIVINYSGNTYRHRGFAIPPEEAMYISSGGNY